MKCGIITFHRAHNYGAILQAYALQQNIKSLDCESEIIDYRCVFIEKMYKRYSISNLPKIKTIIAILLYNGNIKNNKESFESFAKDHLIISPESYFSQEDLKKTNLIYDTYITGSDQVWNYLTSGFDKNYFLTFVNNNKLKNAYAASFGVSFIPNELKLVYKTLLSDFNHISLREKTGNDIVKDLLFKPKPVVIDPTLLLSKDKWLELLNIKRNNEKYILVYLIVESPKILKLARILAKRKNLPIIYISDRLFIRRGMLNRSKVKVEDWVSLFYNAEYVVTNSFHGVCFSINFEKDFFIQYLPGKAKVNSRLNDILDLFNLKNRIVSNNNDIDCIETINYKMTKHILDKEREKAFNYLKEILTI